MGRSGQGKEKIVEAAIKLFDSKGFHGTTVREIAGEAGVNIALLSYYFKSKEGLLEYLMVSYFERLFADLDHTLETTEEASVWPLLKRLIRTFVLYQREHYKVARLIQRQLSVESMLAREIMGTYLAKQKHYVYELVELGVERKEFAPDSVDTAVIHLFSVMTFPYFNPQIIREVYYLEPTADGFVEELVASCERIMESFLFPGKFGVNAQNTAKKEGN